VGGEAERGALTRRIADEVRRMDRVVGALQELARLDADRRSDPEVAVELGGLVEHLASAYRELPGTRATIAVLCAGECWIAVPPESAARVVENLLRNALSFSPPGGVVRLAVESDAGFVQFSVADSGPGVPVEHRARVFERFFTWRPDQPSSDHLGLGLGIVRAIAERYGGSVALREPERAETGETLGGAEFVVRWPERAPARS
jgi:two-component system sensor histidine kinase ChvG